ncbi:MAG: sigma 54-interacting transcriptional regulator [Clostridiales bacterium]|nr:sigma 54-interacting transcriptional regulator [Clostridiales bacterium]
MKAKEYLAILQKTSEVLGEAIHIVDAEGRTIVYNDAMARLEKISVEDVLGKPFREVFPHIPQEESTLYRALAKGEASASEPQTYLNVYGKAITTVNSTVPVEVDGKIIAAIEVAKDITEIKNMSDTILGLQEESLVSAGKVDSKKELKPAIKRYTFDSLIGTTSEFAKAIGIARKASGTDASVFIYGETGTGKELFAQSIHYDGSRKNNPFLAQNCAALPAALLEGILFGTSKGGFTGAVDRAGLFEQANGGTLLLDEISAMPYELQSKLLRVLQEDYIRRVGGSSDIPVDVRIIATVNERPEKLIERGTLRKDLYYRLNIVNINIPPLRERKEDIPLLAEIFLKNHNVRYGKELWMISDRALKKLDEYDYPGNVRELENIIMSAVSLADNEHVLNEKDVNTGSGYHQPPQRISDFHENESSLSQYMERIEKTVIRRHLLDNEGNVSKTAKELGMLRQNLQYKIKKYDL